MLRLHDVLYAVDAIRTGDARGTLRRFAPASDELPVSYPHGARA